MSWAWRVARIRGVDVNVHATFVIFLVWIALASHARGAPPEATIATVLFVVAIFTSVLLHEFGHVVVAQHFNVGTRRITLLPIGGVAELERMPERPREELLVTLAGPAVNVVLGLFLYAVLQGTGREVVVPATGLFGEGHYLARLFWMQVTLVVFNAIPAFPMDGGRVLRALLAMRIGFARATRASAAVGQAIALGFAFLGMFGNPMLLFIGLFVWIGAHTERLGAETRVAIEGVSSRDAAEVSIMILGEADSLALAARRLLAGSQRDFPVADRAGEMVGVLTRDQLIGALRDSGGQGRVGEAMTRPVMVASATASLSDVLARMQQAASRVAVLTEGGTVVGVVTAENVAELVMIRRALAEYDAAHTV